MSKNDLTAAVTLLTGRVPMGAEIMAFSIVQDLEQQSIGYALAYLPDNRATPYVTWKFTGTDLENSGFYFGHYLTDLGEAQRDYASRVRAALFR